MTALPPLPLVELAPHPSHPLVDDAASPAGVKAPDADPNTVRLVIGGVSRTGWQRVQVVRGIEIMPSSFSLLLTDHDAGDAAAADVSAGDACAVYLGSDLVLTGRVDRVRRSLRRGGAVIQLAGRSSCRELVDCAVDPLQVPNLQINQASAVEIIKQLAGIYQIRVQAIGDVGRTIIPQFNVNLGETVYPIIDRIARFAQLLAYDERDGSLNLAVLGAGRMASGFTEGVNIEGAEYEVGMDQRYSDYEVYLTSTYTLSDIGPLAPLQRVTDPAVRPFRKLVVISEQTQLDPSLSERRGVWEKVRRYGRSNPLQLTTDSWRDSAGALWTVNTLVSVNAPHLKTTGQTWLITQVAFRRDESGTHADLLLMPPAAFSPQPIALVPADAEISRAHARAAP